MANPINSRAWTFQERLLSRRVIEVGLYGTVYRNIDPSTGQGYVAHDGWKLDGRVELRVPLICSELREPGPSALNGWQSLMTNYSRLAISLSSDRLPAISAFARFFSPAFGGSQLYASGIWRNTLPVGLLWHANKKEGEELDGVPDARNTAPSWSWASLTCAVSYPFTLSAGTMCADQHTEVIDCNIHLTAQEVEFGEVLSGELRMCGRLRPVHLSLKKSQPWGFNTYEATRSKQSRQHFTVTTGFNDFSQDRGLHRRDDIHPIPWEDRPLPCIIITDREHTAMEEIIGDCSNLFAVSVASCSNEVTMDPKSEGSSTTQTQDSKARHGLLLFKKGVQEYTRVAYFRTQKFNLQDHWYGSHLYPADALTWFREQEAWMDDGPMEEFFLV